MLFVIGKGHVARRWEAMSKEELENLAMRGLSKCGPRFLPDPRKAVRPWPLCPSPSPWSPELCNSASNFRRRDSPIRPDLTQTGLAEDTNDDDPHTIVDKGVEGYHLPGVIKLCGAIQEKGL